MRMFREKLSELKEMADEWESGRVTDKETFAAKMRDESAFAISWAITLNDMGAFDDGKENENRLV